MYQYHGRHGSSCKIIVMSLPHIPFSPSCLRNYSVNAPEWSRWYSRILNSASLHGCPPGAGGVHNIFSTKLRSVASAVHMRQWILPSFIQSCVSGEHSSTMLSRTTIWCSSGHLVRGPSRAQRVRGAWVLKRIMSATQAYAIFALSTARENGHASKAPDAVCAMHLTK